MLGNRSRSSARAAALLMTKLSLQAPINFRFLQVQCSPHPHPSAHFLWSLISFWQCSTSPLLASLCPCFLTYPFNLISLQPVFIGHLWCSRHQAIIIRLWTHSSTLIEFLLACGQCARDRDKERNKLWSLGIRCCPSWWGSLLTVSWSGEVMRG